MSSIPAVKTTTRPTSAGRNFVAFSFLVSGQYFKDYHKILGTLGLYHVRSQFLSGSILLNGLYRSQKGSPTGACKKQELKQFDAEKRSSSTAFI